MRSFLQETAFALASVGISFGLVAFANPARATAPSWSEADQRIIVRIDDLDLHSQAGVATAERRIRSAAERVCGRIDAQDLTGARCRSAAIGSAQSALRTRLAGL